MDYDSNEVVSVTIEELFPVQFDDVESSEDPPESEWSSLILEAPSKHSKLKLHEEGLYDPGSGEICTHYIACSCSSVFRHPYFNYPAIKDPGIVDALTKPEPIVTFADDGQELYLHVCKKAGICPMRCFYNSLLDSKIDLKYYGIHTKAYPTMSAALSRNKFVKILDLSDNWICRDGCFHIGQLLTTNNTITELYLTGCRIGPDGAKRIFCSLSINRSLTKLDLARNELHDEGVHHLAAAILQGADITHLNLSGNKLTYSAVFALCEAFEIRNKLSHLDLSWNTIVAPKAILRMCTYLSDNIHFRELDLSWNGLDSRIGGAIKILLLNRFITKIDLSNNKLHGEAIKFIAQNLNKAKKLQCLNLSFNPLTPRDAMILLQRLRSPAVKLRELLLQDVTVEPEFMQMRQEILSLNFRNDTIITHGYVRLGATPPKFDPRELLLNRIQAIGNSAKSKAKRFDAVLILLKLHSKNPTPLGVKEFTAALKRLDLRLDEDLVLELSEVFRGPRQGKYFSINLNSIVDFIHRMWPDKQTPPQTPPPVVEPVPPPKAKKGKNKKK
ncbi:leucine-rich repeat-containing protein 74B-like [Spodoptera frugiperda]|uniref:Leucine-rich repeat-containing protein 74B-like n=1 Tax=Spodoptera frugiperda TaxID=7108 RepID=A0A9R0D0U0_SPOFR|nr:leucine-rich repeat-containing protein 74B-like [Spodoptera frugiperda]